MLLWVAMLLAGVYAMQWGASRALGVLDALRERPVLGEKMGRPRWGVFTGGYGDYLALTAVILLG